MGDRCRCTHATRAAHGTRSTRRRSKSHIDVEASALTAAGMVVSAPLVVVSVLVLAVLGRPASAARPSAACACGGPHLPPTGARVGPGAVAPAGTCLKCPRPIYVREAPPVGGTHWRGWPRWRGAWHTAHGQPGGGGGCVHARHVCPVDAVGCDRRGTTNPHRPLTLVCPHNPRACTRPKLVLYGCGCSKL